MYPLMLQMFFQLVKSIILLNFLHNVRKHVMPKSYLCLDDLAKKKIKKNFQKKDIIKPIDYAQEKLMTLIVLEN